MPISTRWSSEIKIEIKQSKIRVTSKVVELIIVRQRIFNLKFSLVQQLLVTMALVKHVFDEQSPSGNYYLAEICREWESTALKVNGDVRVALICIGVVLGKDGGALAKMIPLFKMFTGGPIGSGKQWYVPHLLVVIDWFLATFFWIHLDDIVNLIYEALINPSYEG
ncbi:hypothetical protein S83_023196 [Arachis hypogaea]